jgi:hypothetical protein
LVIGWQQKLNSLLLRSRFDLTSGVEHVVFDE